MPDLSSIAEFETTVTLSENILPGLDAKPGKKERVILSYKVIEKTRSFTILKITGAYLFPSKRII